MIIILQNEQSYPCVLVVGILRAKLIIHDYTNSTNKIKYIIIIYYYVYRLNFGWITHHDVRRKSLKS